MSAITNLVMARQAVRHDGLICAPWHEKADPVTEIPVTMHGGGTYAPESFVCRSTTAQKRNRVPRLG